METRAPLPQTPAQIGTRFLLYKRGNRGIQPITTKMSSTALYAAGFDARKSTMVAVHGWTQSSSAFDGLKNVFLKKADYNVILVDWEKGAGITGRWPLAYTQPVQNTRVVGKQIAMLLSHIAAQTQIKLGTVHLIGASLGAQAAGYAGMYLNGTVGRISGLDPAKPNFEGQPIDCKLDKSDAHFVDVIHTDMDIAGVAESIGHIDFFPNGGRMQPGCNSAICSHLRAKSLFRASVWTDCQFQTTRCDGAPCGVSGCPPMGFNAFNPRETRKGDYCLTTTDKPPYCTDNMKNTKPSYPGKVNPSPGSGKPGKATWFNNGKPLPGGNRGNANKLFQEMGSSGVRHQMTFTISFTMFIVGLLARLL
ncbi:pancreatic lipase-related protein 2-like [Amphiura filiformis]|uniref:pancreatic lipase-related protein 2-like n=1 Tax=Amphiura filiformis TaxID=82378 RepID=UPI003B210EFD